VTTDDAGLVLAADDGRYRALAGTHLATLDWLFDDRLS
jgi:hypothetical protein